MNRLVLFSLLFGIVSSCTVGTRQCSTSAGYLTCAATDAYGSTAYTDYKSCGANTECSNGYCVASTPAPVTPTPAPTASPSCVVGTRQCSTSAGFLTCGNTDAYGSTAYTNYQSCGANTECSNGDCVASAPAPVTPTPAPTASPSCVVGSKQCSSDAGFMTCSATDAYGSTAYTNYQSCGANTVCSNGDCVASTPAPVTPAPAPVGTPQCTLNSRQCSSDAGYLTCSATDAYGSTAYTDYKSCGANSVCSNGNCVASTPAPVTPTPAPTASPSCTLNSRQCSSDAGYMTCSATDAYGSTAYTNYKSCGANTVCSNGNCVASTPAPVTPTPAPTASPSCVVGSKKCDTTYGYLTCAKTDAYGSTAYGDYKSCASGTSCKNGVCKK